MAANARRMVFRFLAAAACVAVGTAAGSARAPPAPVDLTGTEWHVEGRLHLTARGRSVSGPTWFDVAFMPGRGFGLEDPGGMVLTGGYEAAGPRRTRLHGSFDPDSISRLEEEIAQGLRDETGDDFAVESLSQSFGARTNGPMSRLSVAFRFRFLVQDLDTGRSVRVQEWAQAVGRR